MRTFLAFMAGLLAFAGVVRAEQDLDALLGNIELSGSVKGRTEGALEKESTAVEQARATAQSRSEYGLELRPRITNEEVGAALRIYLPSRWEKSKLKNQLALVALEEQLRIHALEWTELMQVYRSFCEFRMLNGQLELYQKELSLLDPYLEKADREVELNQLSVKDRARLYALYLDLLNSQEKVSADLLETRRELHLLVGINAELEKMANATILSVPSRLEFETLLQRALENRSDFQLHDVHARSTTAAESVARAEDGFRLKYIQPDIQVDYNNGETSYGISASFVLPWGTRNPDIAVFQRQRELSLSMMDLQRRIIADRLRILLKTADDYHAQSTRRTERISPLLSQLNKDLKTLDTGRMEELRDVLQVRERMFDVELQATRDACRQERMAVDLAEELGTLAQ